MIKPESLAGLFKTCTDSKWLGDVCRRLGGQEVKLDFGQEQMYRAILQDSGLMDDRIDVRRSKWKDQKRGQRGRFVSDDGKVQEITDATDQFTEIADQRCVRKCPADITVSANVQRTEECPPPSIHPSNHPSIHTLSNESVCNTRARSDVPGQEDVIAAATSAMGIPDWYARWWYAEMGRRDWLKTDGKPIGNGNWRPVLMSWWNRETDQRKHEIESEARTEEKAKAKVRDLTAKDWGLCQERCAEWVDGRCRAGKVMPPQLRPWPVPPEECGGFVRLKEAGT